MTPLTPDALSTLNDFHVLIYRLFGVHTSITTPLVPPQRNPWDWVRPTLCDAIRRTPGMLARCDACEAALRRRARVRAASGFCHAGLGQVAIPLRHGRRMLGHVLCSPARFGGSASRMAARLRAGVGDLAYRLDVREEVRQLPILSPGRRAALEQFVRNFFVSFLARLRGTFRTDPHWYHLPVRAPHDTEAWVSYLWIGFEPHTSEPQADDWYVHRAHDVILYAADASCALSTPESAVPVARGRLVVIPAGRRYRIAPPADGAGPPFWIHVVTNVDLAPLALRPLVPPAAALAPLRAVVRGAAEGYPFWYSTEGKLKVLELLLELKSLHGGAGDAHRAPRPRLPDAVERARRFVEAAVDRPLTLRELADRAGLNPFTLIRRFRVETGVTPLAYHRTLRVREAVRLIREERLTPQDAARRTGFGSLQHFSRALKRHTGRPPRAHRAGG